MLDYLDPILLARIQFAFTISFHIIFPALVNPHFRVRVLSESSGHDVV